MAKRRNVLPDNVQWHEPTKRFMARKMYKGHRYCAYHLTSATAALKLVDEQITEAKRKGKPSEITLGNIASEWLATKQERDKLKDSSMYGINAYYNKYIKPVEDTKIQLFDAQEWIDDAKERLKPSTVKNLWSMMNQILVMARRKGLIQYSEGDIILPAVKTKKKEPYPQKAIDAILERSKSTIYYDIILFSLHTGLRREEAIPLKWTDFDLKKGILNISRFVVRNKDGITWSLSDEGKTAGGVRSVPLKPLIVAHLLSMPRVSEWVFPNVKGTHMHHFAIYDAWRKITEDVGTKMKWHDLRHQFASDLLNQGMSSEMISFLLGHTTVQMTHNYSHIAFEYAQQKLNGVKSGVIKKNETPENSVVAIDFSI
jgi:integrase